MIDDFPVPEDLKHLLEKREQDERRTAERREQAQHAEREPINATEITPNAERREGQRRNVERRGGD